MRFIYASCYCDILNRFYCFFENQTLFNFVRQTHSLLVERVINENAMYNKTVGVFVIYPE